MTLAGAAFELLNRWLEAKAPAQEEHHDDPDPEEDV
jgi:hypothetical protein